LATYICRDMRVVKEITDKPVKITVFSWNEKYLIKLEHYGMEQTFKVSEFDILEQEIDEILSDQFIEEALLRFEEMARSLGSSMSKL